MLSDGCQTHYVIKLSIVGLLITGTIDRRSKLLGFGPQVLHSLGSEVKWYREQGNKSFIFLTNSDPVIFSL